MSGAETIPLPTQLTDEDRRPLRNTLLEPPHRYARVGSTITHGLQAEPAVLHFAGIASGERIDMTLRLVNVSGDPLRMHIHPPATPFFSMRCNKKGRVMPGTAQDVTISCRPTDLRYYSDCIRVHCDRGNLIVPIHAYPGVSAINIPKRVDFGFVPLDGSASATLPLRSWVPMEFEYKIDLLQDSPDIRVSPTSGVVPMLTGVDIRVVYTPSRFAVARLLLRITVSQFNFEPVEVEIVGSCDPNAIRQRHLQRLTREAAWGIAASEVPAGLDVVSSIEAGGMGASVLVSPPDKALVAAVATTTGGGAGNGDAVTKALTLQLKALVAGQEVSCKLPEQRPPPEEFAKDGFRVPPDLSTQIAVNRLLLQEQGKIPIQELRLVIAKQNEEAARQQAQLEADAKATLSVGERLREAMAARASEVVALFRELDEDGSGAVEEKEFVQALPLLRVKDATEQDMAELFAKMDVDGSGSISYGELKQTTQGGLPQASLQFAVIEGKEPKDVPPGDIDSVLQSDSRSRQLKELLFTRQIEHIDKHVKDKKVRSFVAVGEALMPEEFVEYVQASRQQHATAVARSEREGARARKEALLSGKRAVLSEQVYLKALGTTPQFDPYSNDNWGLRQQVLDVLQLGVRTALLRNRVRRRTRTMLAILGRANISLSDKHAVRALMLERVRTGGATATVTDEGDDGAPAALRDGTRVAAEHGLDGIAPFAFPTEAHGGDSSRAEPISVSELAPADELKLLALRVPRRHAQMGYAHQALCGPGSLPALETARQLRCGAALEEGRPVPSGEPAAPPSVPLPPALLQPPTASPESVPAEGGATQPAAAPAPADVPAAESAEAGVESAPTAEAAAPAMTPASPAVAAALARRASGIARLGVRAPSAPPPFCETSAKMQLRPRPVPPNTYWRDEAVGSAAGVCLLRQPTISARWRALRDPWADALVELPRPMRRVHEVDVAEELSEDESDTEVELAPPTEQRLREIFLLPDAAGSPGAEEEQQSRAHNPEAAARGVSLENVLPLDLKSELASEDSAVQADDGKEPSDKLLRDRVDELNKFVVDSRRFQLPLT